MQKKAKIAENHSHMNFYVWQNYICDEDDEKNQKWKKTTADHPFPDCSLPSDEIVC